MKQVEICVKDLSIDFELRKSGFLDFVRGNSKTVDKAPTFRAVDNVTFDLTSSDRVGIIGQNGAGKSTLLKIIAGVLSPTCGELKVSGEIFPLLDLSADIIAEATCMQNIRLSGLLKGLTGPELQVYIDSVRKSADIEPFLYSPVTALSTGMRTRFLVSLIGDVSPEILVIDEWIGTADRKFTNEKNSKFSQLVESAQILILASHNRNLIRRFCNKVMVVDKGQLVYLGDVDEGYRFFNRLLEK
ncbi:MAG: ATP-binding cassette domain-containing protein [Acidiferrobacterales bacterium]|nr:ATP-binding cassette domain-containing protein [Acidiferrobacterales bacterium]